MKINNNTRYNTETLRNLFSLAMQLVKKDYGLDWFKVAKLRVTITYARRTYFVSGYAHYKQPTMRISIPSKWKAEDAFAMHRRAPGRPGFKNGILIQQIAATFIHELGHNLGVHHATPAGETRAWATIEHNYADWIHALNPADFPLDAPVKQKTDKREIRYNQALANFEKAATRLKRAKTIFKKWEAKIKYYERTLPQAATRKPE
jgi:hypothetical protein